MLMLTHSQLSKNINGEKDFMETTMQKQMRLQAEQDAYDLEWDDWESELAGRHHEHDADMASRSSTMPVGTIAGLKIPGMPIG